MMVSREPASAPRRPAARHLVSRRLPAGSGGTGRRTLGRLTLSRVAARQARLLRQQGGLLRQEFQAVLGPVDEHALREALQPLKDQPLDVLVSRTEALLARLGGRISTWGARGGLLAQVHGRLAPVLSSNALIDQVRSLAAMRAAATR